MQFQSSRRDLLRRAATGFGTIGLCGALQSGRGATTPSDDKIAPQLVHHPARAKRIIFLFMNGAPSHVDTFDPKPMLAKHEGESPSEDIAGKNRAAGYMPSPFKFAAHGDSGVVMSELLPKLAKHADDLCVIRSMHTDVPNHEPGLLLMQSGHQQPTRPSMGSWLSYGLGTENENLPAFVALSPGLPVVGPQLWSSAFLPGQHQGIEVDTNHTEVENLVSNIRHPNLGNAAQRKQLKLVQALNAQHKDSRPGDAALETHIRSMELAFQMQSEASEAFDLSLESEQTRESYGDSEYGRSCLLGRRLLERGVRVVQVFYVSKGQKQPWDTHKNNNQSHRTLCADADRGTAALLHDLKNRGMLDDTLVIWGGEFGRTPYAQVDKSKDKRKAGRDHHHTGFSMFLAGGGIRGGLTHGSTDDFGMHAVENRVHVHDLHATVLHQMGIDHKKLTFRYSGRDYRLTDVHGRVVHNLIA
ncbi:MAG: sulfatase [Rhodopirellula sp.]|nr:sulfatase [Rhodopirellula sp.]OUX49521.1 MAG: sulfatase [Rhodopirellula sp. TMED283]